MTPVGGELLVLETGYYGLTAKVTKSMTISGHDVSLSLASIAIGGAGAVVSLRGLQLTFPGNDNKTNGITVQSAATVHVEDCVIHGFYIGIMVNGTNAQLSVTNSIIRDNAEGVYIVTASNAQVRLDNSRVEDNYGNGVTIGSGTATITRSLVSSNGMTGIAATGGAIVNVIATTSAHNQYGFYLESAQMTFESAVASNNSAYGLMLGAGSAVRLSNSTFTNNGTGIVVFGSGKALTRGNNTVSGNKKDVDGVLTPLGGV